ncbi:uncharacterized protein BDW47DRAFT_12229 [Aspergillus candidus]|uniref:Uncharacterized protein n=1 Tax=Aspergillus candidus TaxID=41067 RepID=A0A2I2EXL0_ASPCN|nr:hypothetical protein BDW47DRAFT_12229 [Aspergillus candidus]PLB33101.1 hypothetical protein BDW47DRAFT_12229 [Aspergillus candidus]
MSYYEPQGWQAPAASTRQVSWEQPVPPSRSGSSSVSQREDIPAFSSQFDEVDRAIDNLVKSGKLWSAPRRDSMPMMMGRQFPEYDPRSMNSMPPRHHSISDFEASRMHPTPSVQGFYASQRFQGRQGEVEHVMQAKRRMAAQRERELRNYHQEQQYNRSLLAEMSGNKSDRSVSPAAVSEDSRRDLLARQHRALYGNESPAFFPPGTFADDAAGPDSPAGGTPSSAAGVRGPSPRSMDLFGVAAQPPVAGGPDGGIAPVAPGASLQSPSRANSTSSPSSGVNPVFGADPPVTSTASPVGADSPSSARSQAPSQPITGPIGSVGPIGSRPVQQPVQAPHPSLNKRSTTPLPSPLGFGFTPGDAAAPRSSNDRSASSSSNPTAAPGVKEATGGVALGGWGNGSGVWGSKNGLGVQASVWG